MRKARRSTGLTMGLLLLATVPQGCGIAALVAAISYANSTSAEGKARIQAARADWERMNLEREREGLAPLPFPADADKLTPEQIENGREQWGEMNKRRAKEGKDPLPLPREYSAKPEKKKDDDVTPKYEYDPFK